MKTSQTLHRCLMMFFLKRKLLCNDSTAPFLLEAGLFYTLFNHILLTVKIAFGYINHCWFME